MDEQETARTSAKPDRAQALWRIAPMVFFGLIAYLALWVSFVCAFLQYVTVAAMGEKNEQIDGFNRRLRRYMTELFDYLLYQGHAMPFPFGTFPEAEDEVINEAPAAKSAKAASDKPASDTPAAAKPASTKTSASTSARKPRSSTARKASGSASTTTRKASASKTTTPRKKAAPKPKTTAAANQAPPDGGDDGGA